MGQSSSGPIHYANNELPNNKKLIGILRVYFIKYREEQLEKEKQEKQENTNNINKFFKNLSIISLFLLSICSFSILYFMHNYIYFLNIFMFIIFFMSNYYIFKNIYLQIIKKCTLCKINEPTPSICCNKTEYCDDCKKEHRIFMNNSSGLTNFCLCCDTIYDVNGKPSKNKYSKQKPTFRCYEGYLYMPDNVMNILQKYFNMKNYKINVYKNSKKIHDLLKEEQNQKKQTQR